MRARWIRNEPRPREELQAAAAAIGVGALVGAVTFYLARLVLAREPVRPPGELAVREEDG